MIRLRLSLTLALALGTIPAYGQFCPSPLEEAAVARINLERSDQGLDPVELDLRLVEASRRHSQDMAIHDFFSHTGSNGSSFSERIAATGYPSPRSENIAAGYATAEAVVTAWMNSTGHRANILDPTARHVGVGWSYDAASTYGVYWTNNFGSSDAPPLPPTACSMPVIVTGDLDGDGSGDAVFGLEGGPDGIWVWQSDSSWLQLHNIRPQTMVAADLDGDSRDELVADFGDPYGLYARFHDTGWVQLHHVTPEIMAAADLDGDGGDELVVDFGHPWGIYAWFHGAGWLQIHHVPARIMTAADLDGDGGDELVIDFGDPWGIYAWFHGVGWLQIHHVPAEIMTAADLDGDGDDELVIDFGHPWGIYARFEGAGWIQIHGFTPEALAAEDLDGTGRDELLVDFGDPHGVWVWTNHSLWRRLLPISP